MTVHYDVTALEMPIFYNAIRLDAEPTCRGSAQLRGGDHDHDGLMYALTVNVPLLTYVRTLIEGGVPSSTLRAQALARATALGMFFPVNRQQAMLPHPIVRPLVLRARYQDTVQIRFRNEIRGRRVGMHLVAAGYDVKTSDGAYVGRNPSSLAASGAAHHYEWFCQHEGVFVFHDGGNFDGLEEDNEDPKVGDLRTGSTNLHGLFGALCVEPERAIWRDPVTGVRSAAPGEPFVQLDGLYMDILFPEDLTRPPSLEPWPRTTEYTDFATEAHREYVIVFHDEPEFKRPHDDPALDPCASRHGSGHGGDGGGHGDAPPIMPISYRAEPMINREHELFRLIHAGHDFKGRPVLNEEQHHSSWMFGDPATPILHAYIGDPVRIRLLHGGVMETHVFHLHLYEWHAAPQDRDTPRIDAISISPQTGHTIEPVWGAGNRHQVAGDVIWHCHLYPHFHEGMWGMFRTFETLQEGIVGPPIRSESAVYADRRIGLYPDGTPIQQLLPLPGRPTPPPPTPECPGFPLFIPGECRQKSPIPPWPDRDYAEGETPWCELPSLRGENMPPVFDYRPEPTDLERDAFNPRPVPGEMFTHRPFNSAQTAQWADPTFQRNAEKEVCHAIGVTNRPVLYNFDGWVDPKGHFYYRRSEGEPAPDVPKREPLFLRAHHGEILNLTLDNLLDGQFSADDFDAALPPCDQRSWEGECALHVHMVKFDPICADGASTGWNYMSGATLGKRMAYRWWLDQEFGTIFFHDHLFANYRQKRGLFAALIVEPAGARFWDNFGEHEIVTGLQARIDRHPDDHDHPPSFREFCLALADFIPMYDRFDNPLNPPPAPGGHGDQGVMGINYRNEPILLRSGDPSQWFSSVAHGDPATTGFATHAGDPIWFRIIQGSHEEQHSFQIHGLRWRRFRERAESALRNQQTFGLSEAFTFIHDEAYGRGDYLYKLSGADDLWLGCWGLIRAFAPPPVLQGDADHGAAAAAAVSKHQHAHASLERAGIGEPLPLHHVTVPPVPVDNGTRRFVVEAVERRLVYRRRDRPYRADIVDPFGLVYRVIAMAGPGEELRQVAHTGAIEPLVLRCREGEVIELTLRNRIQQPGSLRVEPHAPEVPLDDLERAVSPRVSMHADLVLYDVRSSDGSAIGENPDQTVAPGDHITYRWRTTRSTLEANEGEPIGVVLLQDMGDFRHHRHHGLVGALVVEPAGAVPLAVRVGDATAGPSAPQAWYGPRATVVAKGAVFEEMVLLMQDGLRLYWNGDTRQPLADPPDEHGMPDHEDQGQKGFSYRTDPRGPLFDTRGRPDLPPHEWLHDRTPATPLWRVRAGTPVRLHLVGACDKPRNHSFTLHGVAWPEARFSAEDPRFNVSSESAVTAGTVRTFRFTPQFTGDHAYRSGLLRWDVPQGMWGILRVLPKRPRSSASLEARFDAARSSHGMTLKVAALATVVVGFGWLAWRHWRGQSLSHTGVQSAR